MFKMENLSLTIVVFGELFKLFSWIDKKINKNKILATIISFALALQLEGLPTKKPRLTKYTMKPSLAVSSVSNQIIRF